MKIPPKKSLGQHFLTNPATIDKILRLAKLAPGDRILEIGPGPGRMTERMAAVARQVVAIEKDERLIGPLREKLPNNVEVIEGDVLKINIDEFISVFTPAGPAPGSPPLTASLASLAAGVQQGAPARGHPRKVTDELVNKWKVIANLPYNIATQIIFRLLESRDLFSSFYLMVQKEVADRLVAVPGNKDYGILSIMVQLRAQTRIVMRLPPGAFSPPPKVDSAVVEFLISEQPRYPVKDIPAFEKIVRQAFSQRRKMVRNTLHPLLPLLAKAAILPTMRPEEISIGQYAQLSNEVWLDKASCLA